MPLTFDMPLKELSSYQGCNPRPADFDAFWDNALREMQALDPEVELCPTKFQTAFAECFSLYFTGVGGSRIHAKLLRPKNAPAPHPALLMFHGYTGDSGDWYDKLAYAAHGYTVAALDCRGQAGRSEDRGGVSGNTHHGHIIRGLDDTPDRALYHQIFLDTAQLAKIVMDMPDVDEERVGASGESQGGGLALACSALEPRIRRVAPVYPFLCDYKRVWELDLTVDAYKELQDYFRHFDPMHQREEEVFTKLGYIDVQHFSRRIQGEVLMAVGLMDRICPPSTQFAAYNKIESTKELAIYPDFGHENLPGHQDRIFRFMSEL
ncbi:acetylesterase [candidate division KSB3 bacterium]|uniref:Acetylesterase n=1 Tax=candidate division KSB3 bacterium TaxID=2044937 RepID=A0A2G6E849_9BACT|nr:MAG: acetylesterase [candidate division KSB3 bacterium]PIE30549.1 MAG: acetylesterase [candidate division KSB3 bacterium]